MTISTCPATQTFVEEGGAVAADSGGTAGSSGTSNTKLPYVQLIASTSDDWQGFNLFFGRNVGDAARGAVVDIALGAAASEVVIAQDMVLTSNGKVGASSIWLPLFVPSGSRVAFRQQNSSGQQADVSIIGLSGGFQHTRGFHKAISYGTNLAASVGTSIDPGGIANTKGSYIQVAASVTNDLAGFYISIDSLVNNALTTANFLLDVAVGAAASEVNILTDLRFAASAFGDNFSPSLMGPFFIPIPSGTRIAMRGQSSTIDAADRLFGASIIGIEA